MSAELRDWLFNTEHLQAYTLMHYSNTINRIVFERAKIVVFAAAILLHFAFVFYYSLNLPWIDDYYWYFDFLREINENGDSFIKILGTFFASYNGHLHTPQRLLFLSYIYIFNNINILFFILLGNTVFVLLFYLIIKHNIKQSSGITYREIILGWLFFQPVSYYNFFECAFFNLPVLLFAYLSITSFYRNQIIYSLLLAAICTTLNGNGFLIWIIGILVAVDRRNWKQGLLYALFFAAFITITLLQPSNLVGTTEISLSSLWNSVLFYLQLLGRITYWQDGLLPWISLVIGIFLTVVFAAYFEKFYRNNKKLLLFMLFLLMSMGLIALKRKVLANGIAIIVDTYLMYPQLFLGCLIYAVTLIVPSINLRKFATLFFAFALACINYVICIPQVVKHHDYQIANSLNYNEQKKWLIYPLVQPSIEYKMINIVTKYAIENNYYKIPEFEIKELNTPCRLDKTKSQAVVLADLDDRILNRTLLVQLTDTQNTHIYFPIEYHASDAITWWKSRKNRRIARTLEIRQLNEPVDPDSIKKCTIVELVHNR